MDLTAAFDILNTVSPDESLWDEAFELIEEHGLSFVLSSASERLLLVDLASQFKYVPCVEIPSDEQVIEAAWAAFLAYLARGEDTQPTIIDAWVDRREQAYQYAEVKLAWTFEGAEPPAPDDATYTVFFDGDEIVCIHGPEW